MELAVEIVRSYVEDLRNLLNSSSLPERRAFIRSFVKEVKITGDTPTPTGISEEEVGVLFN